jgi:hypothetical protein
MQLLGPYNTQLQTFLYQQLLALYQQAVAAGQYAGTTPFSETVINNLIQQSTNFASLPTASEGQVVTDDSLNYPLSLLTARYNALVAEMSNFNTKTGDLLSVIEKDTNLLDILISGADLQSWIAQQPVLVTSQQFSWDYGMGFGISSNIITQTDPENGVVYPTQCEVGSYLDVIDGSIYSGLVAPSVVKSVPPQSMSWTWTPMTSGEQSETLYGDAWTELDLLESRPIINFLPTPAVNIELPEGGSINGVFSIGGATTTGVVPIYVQTSFVGRRNSTVLTPENACENPGFEGGTIDWMFGSGWTVLSDGNSHTGSYYAAKNPLASWSSTTSYVPGNTVNYLGYEYVCLVANTDSQPNLPQTINWGPTGLLQSTSFPLSSLNNVYVEFWLKSLGANGIVSMELICMDSNGDTLDPPIAVPGVSSAVDYIQIYNVLQALPSNVVSGMLQISVFGQTQGVWALDDVRIHLPQQLSVYRVDQDNASAYIPIPNSVLPQTMYFINQDFVIDDISNITFMNLPDGDPVTVRFTEFYPAYQCSVNETMWSPLIMLDPARPYPDGETNFNPIELTVDTSDNLTQFPITDETGAPTGLTLEMIGQPIYSYYFEITTPAYPQCGATAQLEIDLSNPTYMNGLVLSPFSSYPLRLVKVETQAFEENTRQVIGTPNALLDRPLTLTFPTTLLDKAFLTLYQESYDLSEYVVQPPDYIRRDALFSIQAVLPYNVQREQRAVPTYYRGAEYIFGIEDVAGIAATSVLPGIFIAGAQHFSGCPDILRYDVDYIDPTSIGDNFDTYLCWIAYNSSDIIVDEELTGIKIYPNTCTVWPFSNPSIPASGTIDHVDIFLKFVLRNPEVVLQKYLLQVANV